MSALPSVGARVRMVGVMENDPAPMEVGAEGTVSSVSSGRFAQIFVDWDNGRSLILLPEDPFEVIG
jgi:hypothetical protein